MDLLNYNRSYFKNLALKKDKTINNIDFDNQFNNIVTHINSKLVTTINSITLGAIKGIFGSPNAVFCNNGDGTTGWKLISNDLIEDNSLFIGKFKLTTPNSIMITNNLGEIVPFSNNINDLVFLRNDLGFFQWMKIETDYIEDDSLTGIAFGELSEENFVPNTFVNNILDNSIQTNHIKDVAITGTKIADNTITIDKFSNLPLILDNNIINALNALPKSYISGCLTPDKILDNSILLDSRWKEYVRASIGREFVQYKFPFGVKTPQNIMGTVATYYYIDETNIAEQSITDEHLVPYDNYWDTQYYAKTIYTQDPRQWCDGYIWPTPLLKIQRRVIKDDLLKLSSFDYDIQTAMRNLGVIDSD